MRTFAVQSGSFKNTKSPAHTYGAFLKCSLQTTRDLYLIQTFTVGSGITPAQLNFSSRTLTAGGELHPAP